MMSTLFSAVFKKVSCLAITVLTLWLEGFGCAFCCSTGTTDLCCTSKQSSCNQQASPVSDCCKQASGQYAAGSTDSMSRPPDRGCSLLPNQAASILTASSVISLLAAPIQNHHFIPKPEIDAHNPASARPLLPANRGSTHLRCCVLLI